MKTELFTPAELADMVDTLAQIKAEIAELQNRADTYKAALIAAEVTEVEGTQHRATISETYKVTIDWRAIAEKLTPSTQLVAAHTHKAEEPTYTLRLTARKVSK